MCQLDSCNLGSYNRVPPSQISEYKGTFGAINDINNTI